MEGVGSEGCLGVYISRGSVMSIEDEVEHKYILGLVAQNSCSVLASQLASCG